MTSRILTLILFSTAWVTQAAAYRDTILADHPVGYWRLGEGLGGTVATNTGSLGAPGNGKIFKNVIFGTPGALAADADTAASLDGNQARIDVPYAAALNPAQFTVEAWAKVTADSTGYRSPMASRDDSPQKGFIFYATPGNEWQFWTGTGVQVGWDTVGGATAEPDAWAHLVGVHDGTNKLFYVNGVLVGANRSVFTPNGARVLRIGASATESPVGDFFFNGAVDEVAVYSQVLSPTRVVAHFTTGTGAAPDATVAPTIVVPPLALDRFKGESATFSALATGSLPLAYQWQKNGVNVPGGTGATLTLANLLPTDGGSYTVIISNVANSATSDPVALTVADVSKPVITTQPAARTVLPGNGASFTVSASGSTVFTYQWQLNGQNLPNATNSTLTLAKVQSASLGAYKVSVKNAAGSTDSAPAMLKFPAAATKPYAEIILADQPTGYWRLGESTGDLAKDSAGANDGAYLNGVTLGRSGALVGDANKAAGFTAAGSTKVDVPWSDSLNGAAFTAEVWAKVTGGGGQYRSPLTSRADGPQRGYIFYAEPGNTWQFWTGKGDSTGWTSLAGPAVQVNTFAHLVGKYNGATLFFYVNGLLVAQRDAAFAPNDLNPLRFGGGATEGNGNYFFEGDVDEAAIYNKALSEDQILTHYVAGLPLATPPAITSQPSPQFGLLGATVKFSVGASGGQPLSYQWKFNEVNLSNGTNSILTLSNLTSANVGKYAVVVSNAGGSITSSNALLSIPQRPTKPYVAVVKADGPVGYWRLDETSGEVAADQIAGNNGDILNGVTLGVPGGIDGDTNLAARFSKVDSQKIDVPWTEVLNPAVFSVEVWARVTGGSGVHRSPLTSRADGPQRGYIFYCEPGDTWQFWSGKGDTSGWDNIPGPATELNKWAHLVGTYDGTTKRFYVNGLLVGTSTAAFAANDQNALRFGGGATEGPGDFFFEGDVDEPAIYNKALTAEQVIQHYLAGTPAAVVVPPTVTLARGNGNLVLTWTSGTLQSTASLGGTWGAVGGATSPRIVTPDQAARFYRVVP